MVFKIGTIQTIKLENFVTYESVTIRPGPNLNLIMGPNGTGKSTILCAIVIGLGGNLHVIGRATTLAAYVRQGFQKAVIEIDLMNRPCNIIISRTFTVDGTNRFEINGHNKSAKDVQELCKSLNIQVDNLCQFLPQDRVQDFAKLNAQELLLNTQRSVSNSLVLETHQELIRIRKDHRELTQEVEKLDEQLKTAQKQNERVQGIVTNIEKQNELKDDIHICKTRLQWLLYEKYREEFEIIKNDRKLAQGEVNKLTKKIEPISKQCDMLQNQLTNKKALMSKARHSLQADISKINDLYETLEQQQQSISHNRNNLLQKIKQSKAKEFDINVLERLMQTTKQLLVESLGEYESREHLSKKVSSLTEEIAKFSQKLGDFESKRSNIINDLNNTVSAEIRLCKNKLSELQNVTARKMDVLRQLSEDAYKAVLWLNENQQLFHGKVYQPMIIELNMTNPDHSKYLENTVSNNDLLAFTCEQTDDVNKLIRKLKIEMHLKVNVIHSAPGNLKNFIPRNSIDSIRRLGFFSYLLGLMDGPEPILSYLCKIYNIHQIPIGSSETNALSDEVPANISLFFSDCFRYVTKVSCYTGQKSITSSQISTAKLFSHNLDMQMQEKIQHRMKQLIKSSDDLNNNISIIETSMQQLNEQKSRIVNERKQVQNIQKTIDNLLNQLKRHKSQIDTLKRDNLDIENEKSNFYKFVTNTATSIYKINNEINNTMSILQNKVNEQGFHSIFIDELMNQVNEKSSEISEYKDRLQDTQRRLANVEAAYDRMKKAAKEKYDEALLLSDNFPPNHDQFPNKSKFDSLPETTDELNDLIEDYQTRMDCLNVGDGNIYQDFQKRIQTIENTSKNIDNCISKRNAMLNILETKGKQWCSDIQELIQKIGENFGRYMTYLDCAGDVNLVPGAAEHDYDEYGISIKVRYRGAEALQELNRFTQSGGERAVATALYLLSLQELTDVPFRCVDEINQGMDAVNERRVFELLVRATSKKTTPQYFLLTPKLLPDLPYTPYISLHIICNGIINIDHQNSDIIDKILNS